MPVMVTNTPGHLMAALEAAYFRVCSQLPNSLRRASVFLQSRSRLILPPASLAFGRLNS